MSRPRIDWAKKVDVRGEIVDGSTHVEYADAPHDERAEHRRSSQTGIDYPTSLEQDRFVDQDFGLLCGSVPMSCTFDGRFEQSSHIA